MINQIHSVYYCDCIMENIKRIIRAPNVVPCYGHSD